MCIQIPKPDDSIMVLTMDHLDRHKLHVDDDDAASTPNHWHGAMTTNDNVVATCGRRCEPHATWAPQRLTTHNPNPNRRSRSCFPEVQFSMSYRLRSKSDVYSVWPEAALNCSLFCPRNYPMNDLAKEAGERTLKVRACGQDGESKGRGVLSAETWFSHQTREMSSEQHEAAEAHSSLRPCLANHSKANAKASSARVSQTPTHHLLSKEDNLSKEAQDAPKKIIQESPADFANVQLGTWMSEYAPGHRRSMTTRTFSRMKRETAMVSGAAQAKGAGFVTVNRHRVNPSFAVVTQANMAQNGQSRNTNAQAASAQGRTPAGKPRASSVAVNAKPSITNVVVLRDGGFTDETDERALRARPPGSIVREVQANMHRHLRMPLKILKGWWAQSVNLMGNFVYTLVGNLPFSYISSFQKYLCNPFPGSQLITTKGWKWAHLRNVLLMNDKFEIWDPSALEEQVRLNPMFAKATFSCAPHWLTDPHKLIGVAETVLFAYEDLDGSITRAALDHGVAMFGAPVQFLLSGDKPTLVQCGRCHQVGHRDGSTFCTVPLTELRFVRCGKNHDSRDHNFECLNPHRVAGTCDCSHPCLLCGKKGHNARSCQCAKRGDFRPPPYTRIRSDKAPAATAVEAPSEEPPPRAPRSRNPRRPKARVEDDTSNLFDPDLFVDTPSPSQPVVGPSTAKSKATDAAPAPGDVDPAPAPTIPQRVRATAAHRLWVLTEENAAGQARVTYHGIEHLVELSQMSRAYHGFRDTECYRLDQIAKDDRSAYYIQANYN
ncbi:hypothetical protein EDB85DRAFT_1904183 [Lactarius pseudohatsudake]|nr:hypothetical protein EDB85DRAFT_1904183 [Lactarius pseudohatsudake]